MKSFIDELLNESPELESSFSDLIHDMPRGQARGRARRALADYRRQVERAPKPHGDRRNIRPAAA